MRLGSLTLCVLTAVSGIGACGTCSDEGCPAGLQIEITTPTPVAEGVEVAVTADATTFTCTLTATVNTCSSPFAVAHVDGDGNFDSLELTGAPARIEVTMVAPSTGTTTATFMPVYANFYPNGATCGPECDRAEVQFEPQL